MLAEIPSTDDDADIVALHEALVQALVASENITTEAVEAAFRAVPRHFFLPDVPPEKVYQDQAIPTKFQDGRPISSSSQPAMMAIMLEQLELQPGQRVLEIGAGTGYNAALMAHIIGPTGRVTTVDLDEDIVAGACQHLAAAGFAQVEVICGDGMHGYAANAPYDRIILTVGSWDIAPAWLEQLKPDGRLLLPLSLNGPQYSIAFERNGDHLASLSIRGCGFMRIRGGMAEPETTLPLGPDPGLLLAYADVSFPVDAGAVYEWLTGRHQDRPTQIEANLGEVWESLSLWLALGEEVGCSLSAQGEVTEKGIVPYLFGFDGESKWRGTRGLLGESGLSLLMRPPDEKPPETIPVEPLPFHLFVRSFGPDEATVHQLVAQVQAWDKAGRPAIDRLRIRIYPIGAYPTAANERAFIKRWHNFGLDWK